VINLWKDISNSGNETAMGLKKYLHYFSPKNMLNISPFFKTKKKHFIGDGMVNLVDTFHGFRLNSVVQKKF
jgi:hypothetical protein